MRKRPEWMKVLSRTDRPDRPQEASPVSEDRALTILPPPPDWLTNPVGRAEWAKVGAELMARGMLDDGRLMPLGIYCALTGSITHKLQAGDLPRASLIEQHTSLARELGILGSAAKPNEAPPLASRLAQIKQRAEEDLT